VNWLRTHGVGGFFGRAAGALPVARMGADSGGMTADGAEAWCSASAAWFAGEVTSATAAREDK
jgi:hypothetical protein